MKDKEENRFFFKNEKKEEKLRKLKIFFYSIIILISICVLILPIIGINPFMLLFVIIIIFLYNFSDYAIINYDFKNILNKVKEKIQLYKKKLETENSKGNLTNLQTFFYSIIVLGTIFILIYPIIRINPLILVIIIVSIIISTMLIKINGNQSNSHIDID